MGARLLMAFLVLTNTEVAPLADDLEPGSRSAEVRLLRETA